MVAANREQGMPVDAPRGSGGLQAVSGFGARVAVVAAAPLAIVAGLLAVEEALELGSSFLVTALTAGLAVVAGMLVLGLRDLRAAEARTRAAVDRAVAAEAAQRSRADELARVLAEVQRVQQQLVQASKLSAVGELAAAVAHEVNNPLTGILGYAELLMDELPEDDPRHGEVAVIRDEAVRARTIVKALLEFARPRRPQRVPTNLNDLARSTLELVRFRASAAEVAIAAEYGDLPSLDIDADSFGQVLLNLFSNAVDAMPRGGRLRVATVVDPERVGVVVSDEGVGMDEETRARIFTPFFSTRPDGTGGDGLGLSVSLQIVESHGGTIEVESTPGGGSTFTVWLPNSRPAGSRGSEGSEAA